MVTTPAGDDGSVLVVVTDVTESRRIDAIRRDFVANASHELKTPAASIQAAAETLRDAAADDPEAVARFAAQLERDALRLSRIVMDLLDLSRLETEHDGHGQVQLETLVHEEVERAAPMADGAGVALEIAADAPAPRYRVRTRPRPPAPQPDRQRDPLHARGWLGPCCGQHGRATTRS